MEISSEKQVLGEAGGVVTLTNGKKKRYLVVKEIMFENFFFRNLKEIPWNYKCLVTSNQANPMMDRERGERMREILQIQVKIHLQLFCISARENGVR